MNYYLPALAEWRDGLPGQAAAWLAERLAAGYNALLDRVYTASGARVANVFGTFESADFAGQAAVPGLGTVPRNVALLCRWTWECAAPPRGPNQHANKAGYQVIAGTCVGARPALTGFLPYSRISPPGACATEIGSLRFRYGSDRRSSVVNRRLARHG